MSKKERLEQKMSLLEDRISKGGLTASEFSELTREYNNLSIQYDNLAPKTQNKRVFLPDYKFLKQ